MMTSSGDDNWPSESLGLLTDKTKKTEKNKPKAEQETAQPTAARFNKRRTIQNLLLGNQQGSGHKNMEMFGAWISCLSRPMEAIYRRKICC